MRKTKSELPKFKSRPKRMSAEEKRNANIIALHKEGVSFHHIAKLFEISKETVENICKPGKKKEETNLLIRKVKKIFRE